MKLLWIMGTQIRDKVPDCQNCRLHSTFDGEHLCAVLDTPLNGEEIENHHLWTDGKFIDERCPLPTIAPEDDT